MFSSPDWQSPDAAPSELAARDEAPTAAEVRAELVRRRRRRRRWLLAAVVLLPLLVLLAIWLPSLKARRAVQAELARIAAAGEPVTVDDLNRMYVADTGSPEATRRWLAALDRLAQSSFLDDAGDLPRRVFDRVRWIPSPRCEWPELANAKQLLAKHRQVLDDLHEAVSVVGVCRYSDARTIGHPRSFTRLSDIRQAMWAIQIEAHVCAHESNGPGTLRAIHSLYRLVTTLEGEPSVLAQLVRVACMDTADDITRSLAPYLDLSPANQAAIEVDLRAYDHMSPVYRAMVGARVFGWKALQDPYAALGLPPPPLVPRPMRSVGWHEKYCFLQVMSKAVEATVKPMPLALATAKQADAQYDETLAHSLMGDSLVPPVVAVVAARGRLEASRDATLVVLAVERYFREHGHRPERIEELVPAYLSEVPRDPFDGQPLRYVPADDHYLVYSTGPDGIDHGGVSQQPGGDSPDLVYRVELAPALRESAARVHSTDTAP